MSKTGVLATSNSSTAGFQKAVATTTTVGAALQASPKMVPYVAGIINTLEE